MPISERQRLTAALASHRLDDVFATIARLERTGRAPLRKIQEWRKTLCYHQLSLVTFTDPRVFAARAQIDFAKRLPAGTFSKDRSKACQRRRDEIVVRLSGGAYKPAS